MAVLIAALAGLVAGGIVNVLADDLPQRHPVRRPHYPDDLPREPFAWLSVVAFLAGRRASPSGAALSWRSPLVELTLAAIYGVLAYAHPFDLQQVFQMVILAALMLITVIDLEHRLILFVVIWPSCLIALAASAVSPGPPDLLSALIGGVVGFLTFYLMYLGGFAFSKLMGRIRGEEISEVAFGFGDVMLAGLSGLLIGWQAFIFALILTVLFGALGAALYLLARMLLRSQYTLFTALPYGPYIVLATVIMMFWRDEVRALLLR